METKKVLTIIFSLVFVALFGFVLSWGIINFNKVKEGMSGTELYTNEDLKNSYQDGYDTALQDKVEYEELINGYRDNITTLTDNISSLNSQVAALTNVNKDYQNQIKNLNEIKQLNEETIAQLNGTISLNTITIDELNSQVNSLTNTKTSNENTIKSLNKTIEENNALISSLNAEIDELEREVENNETTIEELNNQISLLQTENSNKQLEIDTLTTTNSSLNNQITNLNSLVNELQTSNDNNLSTIQSLNNQISLQKAQIVELQNQQNANDVSIYELNNKITDLEKSIDYYESYIFELESANHLVGIFEFNGSVYSICEVDDNGLVSVENPESTEFVIFNYWTVNGEQVDLSNYVLTENTKFVANVTYNYKVKFLVDDSVYNEQLVENGNKVVLPENPSKEKYDFVGWSLNGVDIIDLTNYSVESDITIIAIFQSTYGLFNADTGAMVYTWDELINYDYLKVDDVGILSAGANSKRLSGNLKLDNGITEIAASTFADCAAVVEIDIPEGVTQIGASCMSGCYSLKSLKIPKSLTSFLGGTFGPVGYFYKFCLTDVSYAGTIEDWCKIDFAYDTANPIQIAKNIIINNEKVEGTIEIPNTITEIKQYAFVGFNNDFILPNSIKTIGKYAFSKIVTDTFEVPSSIETMADCVFYESKVRNVILPKAIKDIPASTFYSCTNLESIDLSGVETIGEACFSKSGLVQVDIPSTITSIAKRAFEKCSKLQVVNYNAISLENRTYMQPYFEYASKTGLVLNIGSAVKHIPSFLMYNSDGLNIINIPETVETCGQQAFYNCNYITECNFNAVNMVMNNYINSNGGLIYYSNTKPAGNNITVNIGANVEKLNNDMFNCTYLLTAVRYASTTKLNYIGSEVFYHCDNLNDFYIPSTVVEIISYDDGRYSPWAYSGGDMILYCEVDSALSTYSSKWNWYDYSNQLTVKYGYTYEQYLAEISSSEA